MNGATVPVGDEEFEFEAVLRRTPDEQRPPCS
jgi:hypothetical protein